jgi:hypothetical protein
LVKRTGLALAIALLVGCREPDRVDARSYDSFWLWAGVAPQPVLRQAQTIYILDGEVRGGEEARYAVQLAQPPRLPDKQVWLVVRTDTLEWPESTYSAVLRDLGAWETGNKLAGVQLDFDARTRHLDRYADFLRDFRKRLPGQYRLSITGLLDWSANGDPRSLRRLKGVVDELVIQTYQGRSTIWGYERYFERMRGFPIPFKVGLVENDRWIEPPGLRREPNFRGYVVFLVNPRR